MSGSRLSHLASQVTASTLLASTAAAVPLNATGDKKELPLRDPRFVRSGGTAMVHIPQITAKATAKNPQIPSMTANESERNSETWLDDFASSPVPGKEMTAGLFRMNAGPALEYVYIYEEIKLIVEGEFHLTDGTGQKVVAKAGDLMYFPKGSKITFATPNTALGYFCGQRAKGTGDYVEPVTDPELKAALASNPRMVHHKQATTAWTLPKMMANQTEANSQTWLGDIALSTAAGKELASGLFRMNAGQPLEYYYDYEEMKYIVEGEFHLTDGTGQKVVAKAGDLMYFPKGSSIVFDTPNTALGCFCGQRLVDVPALNPQ